MGKGSKRQYTLEFKQQAAELAKEIGISQAALKLGVSVSAIRQWKKKAEESNSKPKSGMVLEEENRRLRKEVEELKKVNYILKRAAAFFSQDHLK